MTKSQPLDKQPQQHLLDAYGGTEAGTSLSRISFGMPRWLHLDYRGW